ncbi:MAG: glycoside hydrolase [Chloroflexi bacterium]|nr:glycoside hydrolase [Chloroflexota bacterium]MBL7062037.1 glycoside hydrolase [Dehalococcoidia bacterium]
MAREKKTIYLVPHSHYDVVWAFNKEDYYHINEIILKNTVEMIKNSDFRFLIEQTYLLEMIEKRNPSLFSDIKEAVARHKIEIADGQYVMPDQMMPLGELLVREILLGKNYCKQKFGVDVPVAWAADGFGLNAQMPQLYRKSGYRWLAFRRGLPKSIGYRVSEFVWVGLDGSKILSHWMPLGYRAGLEIDKWEESYQTLSDFATTSSVLMPCGSGGVPPQIETPDKVKQWNTEHDDSNMIISVPSEFFKNLEKEAVELSEYRGELYSPELENVFPDVVSSRMGLKLAFKDCENALITAEKIATLAWIYGRPYPVDVLSQVWREMLFLVNHDVISCCGIDEIYDEAWEYISDIKEKANRLMEDCAHYLSKGSRRGNSISVFNPNNWEITDWVEVEVELPPEWNEDIGIASNGDEIPSEVLEFERKDDGGGSKARLGFVATVPPMGCRLYQLVRRNSSFDSGIEVHGNEVINKFFKLSVDSKTGIVSVFSKDGRKLLEGNELVIDQEIGDLYFHKSQFDEPIGSESGKGIHFSTFMPEELKIEKGPVRTVITFRDSFYCLQWPYYLTKKFGSILQRHKTLDICKQIMVYNDIPRIGFHTTIRSAQSHIRIRVRFDTCMVVPNYTRQTQFGVIDLPLTKTLEESVRFPSLNWFNCQEGRHGLAFFNRGVPINEIKAGNIYCTLLRSVSVLSTDGESGPLIPTPKAMELGEHTYTYAVFPHSGDWKKAEIHRHGHQFNHRLFALQTDSTALTCEFDSFILEPDNLIISAIKKAENYDAVILRFFETRGEKCHATLQMPPRIKSASCVNLLEEEETNLAIEGGMLEMDVSPFEIVTLKLSVDAR